MGGVVSTWGAPSEALVEGAQDREERDAQPEGVRATERESEDSVIEVPEGIAQNIRTVLENAYLRAAVKPMGRQVVELSASQRETILAPFLQSIEADVRFLRTAFVQFAAEQAANQVDERLHDVEMAPVVMDTKDGESE